MSIDDLRLRHPGRVYRLSKLGHIQQLSGRRWCRVCRHGKRYNQCRECGGASICVHARRRVQCITCKGASVCVHGKRRTQCISCKGASMCSHDKRRVDCTQCMSIAHMRQSGRFCQICFSVRLSTRRRRVAQTGGLGVCAACDASAPMRSEDLVWSRIKDRVPTPSARDDTLTGGCSFQLRRRRPDVCWVCPKVVVHLEVDSIPRIPSTGL